MTPTDLDFIRTTLDLALTAVNGLPAGEAGGWTVLYARHVSLLLAELEARPRPKQEGGAP